MSHQDMPDTRAEVDMSQVLLQSDEVRILLPEGPIHPSLGKLIANDLKNMVVVEQFKAAMKPVIADMQFETEAAERGAAKTAFDQ